ncbi:hypothetical protein [Kitasatospora sp. LaBMicrA B282]|uniref:hypothetical protein n=1 Tax=Kitasatospora sp. LaBMicrA B282 TaxID=3420949 RepID=UPI003D0BC102
MTEVEDWYTPDTMAGFPLEEVQPYLGSCPLGRVHTGWVLAIHRHEPAWIAGHLDLPEPLAEVLVAAAERRV